MLGGVSMFHAIIVEDESKIATLIRELVDWDVAGVSLDGIFENGRDALYYIQEYRPDIVITDVKMPILDGIGLIEAVRAADISCSFIIISGFRNFEYARSALRYSVTEYLLKPISQEELCGAISRIVESRKQSQLTSNRSSAQTRSLRDIFMEQFLNEGNTSNLDEAKRKFGIALTPGIFQCLIYKIEGPTGEFRQLIGELVLSTRHFLDDLCYELVPYAEFDNKIIFLLNYAESVGEAAMRQHIEDLYPRLSELLPPNTDLTVGISEVCNDFSTIDTTLDSAREALSFRLAAGGRHLYFFDEYHFSSVKAEDIFPSVSAKSLSQAVDSYNLEQIINSIGAIFRVASPKVSPAELIRACCDLIDTICAASDVEALTQEAETIKDMLWEQPTLEQLRNLIINWAEQHLKKAQQDKQQQSVKPIKVAKEYIEQHLAHPLSLEEVSAVVHLNPSYFSTIFKRDTGQNFSEYVTMMRINLAKRLLTETTYRISEISEQVGYTDHCYFSRLFTKYVGIKPSAYRKLH